MFSFLRIKVKNYETFFGDFQTLWYRLLSSLCPISILFLGNKTYFICGRTSAYKNNKPCGIEFGKSPKASTILEIKCDSIAKEVKKAQQVKSTPEYLAPKLILVFFSGIFDGKVSSISI